MSKYLFRVFNVGRSLYPGYLYIGKREKKVWTRTMHLQKNS